MNGRFFIDTDIFVYSFDASSPKKAAQARKLIRRAIETRGGIVSYQVVQEFFNVALRRFSKPMSGVDAEQYLVPVRLNCDLCQLAGAYAPEEQIRGHTSSA
jgi:predicted nucleic acid-binding protein